MLDEETHSNKKLVILLITALFSLILRLSCTSKNDASWISNFFIFTDLVSLSCFAFFFFKDAITEEQCR